MGNARKQHGPPATAPAVEARAPWWASPGLIAVFAAAVVVLIVAAESVVALAIVIIEGGLALGVPAAAGLAGGWIMPAIGLGREPLRDRLIIGAALGVGALSLIVLALGSAGLLNRPVSLVLVAALALAGVARLALDLRRWTENSPRWTENPFSVPSVPPRREPLPPALGWLWLAVCPFLAIALLAACLPPGILWAEEGYGYDVLEYHLAVPKLFYQAGHVHFLPNNVYGNFPLNSEMLSLLMMTLKGDPIEASFAAQLANVGLAGLFVAAAWLAGRTVSPLAGLVAGVLAGTLGWLPYLAGIAYVEPGMLAMGMACLVAGKKGSGYFCRKGPKGASHKSSLTPSSSFPSWLLVAGLLGGLAGGFKYTAIPLIAVPAAVLTLLPRAAWRERAAGLALFALGCVVTLAPWLLRNALNTHDPVFPLGYRFFGAKAGTWDSELEARWQYAHGPAGAAEATFSAPARLIEHTAADPRMGVAIFILAAFGAARVRDRWTAGLLLMFVAQVVFWLAVTHQYARFAVVVLLPLVLLALRAAEAPRKPLSVWLAWGLILAGAGSNLQALGRLYRDHTRPGGEPIDAYGHTDWFTQGQWPGTAHVGAINAMPSQAQVMLVGEARGFYIRRPCEYATVFNRHPLADAAAQLGDAGAVLQWLRERGTTHLLAHWAEIRRLRRSYGFYPEITAELFEGLTRAGLVESATFAWGDDPLPYATLFEVPR